MTHQRTEGNAATMKSNDQTEPCRAPIPALRRRRQPNAVVREAYWYATRLYNHGWQIYNIWFDGSGHFNGLTPTHRAIKIDCAGRESVENLPTEFAYSIRRLGELGEQHRHDYLRDLRIFLGSRAPALRPTPTVKHYWRIPGLSERRQPRDIVRAAYWLAATLTDDYGWALTEIGADVAGCGFFAHIPDDATIMYPADMADDGTTAATLARMIGELSLAERAQLSSLITWHAASRAQLSTKQAG